MDMTAGVLILGGNRGTGFETAKILAGRGDAVTVLVRPDSDAADLEKLDVHVIRGNVLDEADVRRAFASGAIRAVVNTVGGRRGERPRPDVAGVRNMIVAAGEAGVSRAVLVTAIGAGDSRSAVAPKVLEVLGEVLALKTEIEDDLMQSGLDYTILRPGGMTFEPASGTAIKTGDHSVMGVIHRADLAQLIVDCLDDDQTIGSVLHAVDPEIKWQAPLQRGDDMPEKK
jgi:uncharacterized protein YbjT (DUF2867 family)